jgi:hypothetical protein
MWKEERKRPVEFTKVAVGVRSNHAGHIENRRDVDAADASVGDRAADEGDVQNVRDTHIVEVHSAAT